MTRAVGDLRSWLAGWGACVASVDVEAARPLFRDDVVGYGTKATVARGIDNLIAEQWSQVWPNIEGFAFDSDGADVWLGPDGLHGVIAAAWSSLGRTAIGNTFTRNGRATVVVERASVDDPWLGVHTHFSLEPLDPGTHIAG